MGDLRLLEQRINQLLEQRPDPNQDAESVQEICALIRRQRLQKEALEVLKDPIKRGKPPLQIRALHILALLVQYGDANLHVTLATRRWMERLAKVAKTKDEALRDAVYQNLVNWNARFSMDVAYIEFNVAVKRLEQKNVPLPLPNALSLPGVPTSATDSGFGSREGSVVSTSARPVSPGTGPPAAAAPGRAPTQVEAMIAQIQQDLRTLENSLQEPDQLQPSVVDKCRRWQRKIELMLSTDLNDQDTFQLIALGDQVGEYIELYRAIFSEENRMAAQQGSPERSAPEEVHSPPRPDVDVSPPRGPRGAQPESPSPPRERAPAPPETDSPREARDPAEMERLQEALQQTRNARKAVEEECDVVRRQINDVKAQQGMNAAVDASPAGASNLKAIARATAASGKRIIRQARTLQGQFAPVREIRQKTTAYAREFESDIETAAAMAERSAKAEAKGFENLKKIYLSEMQLRKKLFAQIQEFRGNTRIFCRVRPLSAEERALGEDGEDITGFPGSSEIILKEAGKPRMFEVDAAFKPTDKTKPIFDELSGMVECAVDGFNVAFFAYGQSGSGKSHTLFGNDRDPGLFQQSLESMFALFRERFETEANTVSLSALEITNEAIRDAFDPRAPLQIQQSDQIGTYIEGLSATQVSSPEDGVARLRRVQDTRDRSGRAALCAILVVQATNTQSGVTTTGKLAIVDLTPSEKQVFYWEQSEHTRKEE
eukprot:TRINITY_DN11189_c0_g1_i3.p1 TRINITY_DN11189_c0_g1~~TRINITY_DN11189_c0_g1_i3.p1  ORF type:complete len:717 (-),score=143.11 TRINITY_DN11189_c0_g1_i3:74-2224(-)